MVRAIFLVDGGHGVHYPDTGGRIGFNSGRLTRCRSSRFVWSVEDALLQYPGLKTREDYCSSTYLITSF